jgi:hypothetical protein
MTGITAGGLAQFNGAEVFAQENLRRAEENREGREVRLLEVKKPEAPQTILKFASPEEIAHVQSFREKITSASAEVSKIESALYANTRALNDAKTRVVDRSAELAARALGESAKALPSTPAQSIYDLEATRSGLESRLSEARATVDAATGQRRAAYVDLIKTCGQRAKDEYTRLASELEVTHRLLSTAAERLRPGELFDWEIWGRLFVPGFRGMREEYSVPTAASGFQNTITLPKANDALRQKTEELFGKIL